MLESMTMKATVLAVALLPLCGSSIAAPLSPTSCAALAAQVDGSVVPADLDLPRLVRDGDPEVAAAARRLQGLRSGAPQQSPALLVNAVQDLRYQLQVCARR